jgi:hypothetical protein
LAEVKAREAKYSYYIALTSLRNKFFLFFVSFTFF